jgi:cytoskeletal protein CcmA (bactofilin family)
MFKNKQNDMSKNNIAEAKPNTIVSGTIIKGEITAEGDFRIDGTLVGSINCKGKIVIGQTGSIEGEIICQNADVSGKVKAHLKVEQLFALKSTADFYGDIETNKISIEPGAKFNGSCNMETGNQEKTKINVQNGGQERAKEKLFK